MKQKIIYLLITVLLSPLTLILGQKEKSYIRHGTSEYDDKKYGNSEVSYQKALTLNPESFEAKFNLGDAFYKQGKYDESVKEFSELAGKTTEKDKLGKIYHNIGNSQLNKTKSLLEQQKLDESLKQIDKSIEAYKNALKNNPDDRETKFNLSYAQKLKKKLEDQKNKNQNNQDKNNQDQKDNQNDKNDQNKDQQDQNKNQDKNKPTENDKDGDGIPDKVENENDQNNPRDTDKDGVPDYRDSDSDNDGKPDSDEAGKNPEKPQDTDKDGLPDYRDLDSNNDGKPDSQEAQQDKDNKISKEDALRILEAILNDEKDVQGKLKKVKAANSGKLEKDW
ncbi:MAG: tetratricopeptide repeat protein [Bacteroidales bacterium]